MFIFIIGPWGVGKSTSWKILAKLLTYNFIDLDNEFSNVIWNITTHIQEKWYEDYCNKNSDLFYKIVDNTEWNTIFVLSSGFLAHEGLNELTDKHKKSIQENWVSILLLPSKSKEESTTIVVKRQLSRGFGLHEEKERIKFIKRFEIYKKFWNIKIFSHQKPNDIAEEMKEKLKIFFNEAWLIK